MTTARDVMLNRVRGEFSEMPGLRLTMEQAQRLWALPSDTCHVVLVRLIDEGFLRQTANGAFVRRDGNAA